MKIIALVVTFNRQQLLRETLDALEAQTTRPFQVVVVDNNSNDGTDVFMIERQHSVNINYQRLNKNIGGAGGFRHGMQCAYESGADWLWCMDDDCVPNPDALEKLLLALDDKSIKDAGFLASRVVWIDGSPCLMNLPAPHQLWIGPHEKNPMVSRIVGSSFVSMLVARKAIEAVGYPIKEFFIWFDDAEFSRRISELMPAYLVTNSVVVHKTTKNTAPLDFFDLDDSNLWKYCYGVRNEVSFYFYKMGVISAIVFFVKVMRRMYIAKIGLRYWFYILNSALNGVLFNHLNYIEYPV
jgi:GT2 family glycosyltransferase